MFLTLSSPNKIKHELYSLMRLEMFYANFFLLPYFFYFSVNLILCLIRFKLSFFFFTTIQGHKFLPKAGIAELASELPI